MAGSLYKVEAIVLRKRRIGERDQVLTLLTPSHGRLDLSARGSRRPAASVAARLEPFMQVRLLVARGRSLDIISQADVIDGRRDLAEDLSRLAFGTYLLELFYRLVEPGAGPSTGRLYQALVRSLDELAAPAGVEHDLLCRRAELRLWTILGCAPELDVCMVCQERCQPHHFSLQGGVVCGSCRPGVESVRPLSVEAWHLLRLLRSPRLADLALARDAFEPFTFGETNQHLAAWMEWHASVPMRSRHFLGQIERPRPACSRRHLEEHASCGEAGSRGAGL